MEEVQDADRTDAPPNPEKPRFHLSLGNLSHHIDEAGDWASARSPRSEHSPRSPRSASSLCNDAIRPRAWRPAGAAQYFFKDQEMTAGSGVKYGHLHHAPRRKALAGLSSAVPIVSWRALPEFECGGLGAAFYEKAGNKPVLFHPASRLADKDIGMPPKERNEPITEAPSRPAKSLGNYTKRSSTMAVKAKIFSAYDFPVQESAWSISSEPLAEPGPEMFEGNDADSKNSPSLRSYGLDDSYPSVDPFSPEPCPELSVSSPAGCSDSRFCLSTSALNLDSGPQFEQSLKEQQTCSPKRTTTPLGLFQPCAEREAVHHREDKRQSVPSGRAANAIDQRCTEHPGFQHQEAEKGSFSLAPAVPEHERQSFSPKRDLHLDVLQSRLEQRYAECLGVQPRNELPTSTPATKRNKGKDRQRRVDDLSRRNGATEQRNSQDLVAQGREQPRMSFFFDGTELIVFHSNQEERNAKALAAQLKAQDQRKSDSSGRASMLSKGRAERMDSGAQSVEHSRDVQGSFSSESFAELGLGQRSFDSGGFPRLEGQQKSTSTTRHSDLTMFQDRPTEHRYSTPPRLQHYNSERSSASCLATDSGMRRNRQEQGQVEHRGTLPLQDELQSATDLKIRCRGRQLQYYTKSQGGQDRQDWQQSSSSAPVTDWAMRKGNQAPGNSKARGQHKPACGKTSPSASPQRNEAPKSQYPFRKPTQPNRISVKRRFSTKVVKRSKGGSRYSLVKTAQRGSKDRNASPSPETSASETESKRQAPVNAYPSNRKWLTSMSSGSGARDSAVPPKRSRSLPKSPGEAEALRQAYELAREREERSNRERAKQEAKEKALARKVAKGAGYSYLKSNATRVVKRPKSPTNQGDCGSSADLRARPQSSRERSPQGTVGKKGTTGQVVDLSVAPQPSGARSPERKNGKKVAAANVELSATLQPRRERSPDAKNGKSGKSGTAGYVDLSARPQAARGRSPERTLERKDQKTSSPDPRSQKDHPTPEETEDIPQGKQVSSQNNYYPASRKWLKNITGKRGGWLDSSGDGEKNDSLAKDHPTPEETEDIPQGKQVISQNNYYPASRKWLKNITGKRGGWLDSSGDGEKNDSLAKALRSPFTVLSRSKTSKRPNADTMKKRSGNAMNYVGGKPDHEITADCIASPNNDIVYPNASRKWVTGLHGYGSLGYLETRPADRPDLTREIFSAEQHVRHYYDSAQYQSVFAKFDAPGELTCNLER